jgi:hypothetical protein
LEAFEPPFRRMWPETSAGEGNVIGAEPLHSKAGIFGV